MPKRTGASGSSGAKKSQSKQRKEVRKMRKTPQKSKHTPAKTKQTAIFSRHKRKSSSAITKKQKRGFAGAGKAVKSSKQPRLFKKSQRTSGKQSSKNLKQGGSASHKRGKDVRKISKVRTVTPEQVAEIFAKQKAQEKAAKQQAKAEQAARLFRPRREDRGKFIFIGVKGSREARAQGKKGYLVFVDKNGKKEIIKQFKNEFRPSKFVDAKPPIDKKHRQATKDFTLAKRKLSAKGNAFKRGEGSIKPKRGADFNNDVVKALAKSLRKSLTGQASHRRFVVTVKALVQIPGGGTEVFEINLDIAKADHIAIQMGGIENFVRHQLYLHLARQLEFAGYVTAGSANHIRKLKDNIGNPREDWVDSTGRPWKGAERETVNIVNLEWIIEQAE